MQGKFYYFCNGSYTWLGIASHVNELRDSNGGDVYQDVKGAKREMYSPILFTGSFAAQERKRKEVERERAENPRFYTYCRVQLANAIA
jgi:hypothetical protein